MKIVNPDDPMRDLYPTCGQAFKAGERHGIDNGLEAAIRAVGDLYVKHEMASDPVPFNAVGECLIVLRRLKLESYEQNSLAVRQVEGSA